MDRREFLHAAAASGLLAASGRVFGDEQGGDVPSFEFHEATVGELSGALQEGRESSLSLTRKYLERIRRIDKSGPAVNSIIELNPDAEAIAQALDEQKGPRGPLHGLPILIKDNIDTADKMHTTAGSLALATSIALQDSFVAKRLRSAGAVILGKTNLSEWANFRSTHSTSGWSGRGGQTRNPYALDRNPCGSSSGSGAATSAGLCVAAVGTETDGSIVCPATTNGIVGLKPTVGLIGRTGIIPISHTQDTAGPMARTVRDVAILLTALAGRDPEDAAAKGAPDSAFVDYTQFLKPGGLKGARIGVARKFSGFNDKVDSVMEAALHAMREAGAVLIDPAEIATNGKFDDSEQEVLLYEFKTDLEAYLARLAPGQPRTFKDLIRFNEDHKDSEMAFFGQELFLQAAAKGPLTEAKYKQAMAKNRRLARKEGIDAVMDQHQLDAIVAPTGGPAWTTDLINGDHFSGGSSSPAAVAGYPDLTIPAGLVHGLPVGISFFGRAWSEPVLLRIGYAFEQATKARSVPKFYSEARLLRENSA